MIKSTRKLITSIIFCVIFAFKGYSQEIIYHDAIRFTIIGKKDSLGPIYHRVDTATYNTMPASVKHLFTNSSGLAVCFKTNSPEIWAEWTVHPKSMGNMAPMGHSGLDLYIKKKGQWVYAESEAPTGATTRSCIIKNMAAGEKECILYFPLYNELKDLKIGIRTACSIKPLPNPFKKKIIVYGSSITQGAAASRPGLAYPARLSRETGYEFVNLGLSGNGKMERSVAEMLADIEADAYILDCMPNPSTEQIKERTAYLVKTIRKRHPSVPVIMIESVYYENANFDTSIYEREYQKREAFYHEYLKLKEERVPKLYYIKGEKLIGENHEGTIDGVHPTDEGFATMTRILKKNIVKILKKNGI